MAANPDCLIIVGPCRLSWLNVFKPREKMQNGALKRWYEATLLFPKGPAHPYYVAGQYDKLIAAIRAAIADEFGPKEVDKYMNAPDNVFKMCLKDGDVVTADDGKGNWVPKYPGYWFVNATAKEDKPPRLMNAHDKSEARAVDGWVSGDWAKAQLNFYAFNNESKGVAPGLRALQFCYKDTPFGTGAAVATADDFGDVPGAHAPTGSRDEESAQPARGGYRSVVDDITDALMSMPPDVRGQWQTYMEKNFGSAVPYELTGQQQDKLWRAMQA